MSKRPIQKILAAVDLSSCSRAALEFACTLAMPFGARIEIMFVQPKESVTPGAGSEVATADQLAAATAELRRFITSVPGTRSVPCSERLEVGDAQERIVHVAESESFDLVVLGTHGRTGRPRSLAGSVAESVVRTSSCPVITVRESR
jgi:nucleotide-binding universal stress UspA family protein